MFIWNTGLSHWLLLDPFHHKEKLLGMPTCIVLSLLLINEMRDVMMVKGSDYLCTLGLGMMIFYQILNFSYVPCTLSEPFEIYELHSINIKHYEMIKLVFKIFTASTGFDVYFLIFLQSNLYDYIY